MSKRVHDARVSTTFAAPRPCVSTMRFWCQRPCHRNERVPASLRACAFARRVEDLLALRGARTRRSRVRRSATAARATLSRAKFAAALLRDSQTCPRRHVCRLLAHAPSLHGPAAYRRHEGRPEDAIGAPCAGLHWLATAMAADVNSCLRRAHAGATGRHSGRPREETLWRLRFVQFAHGGCGCPRGGLHG